MTPPPHEDGEGLLPCPWDGQPAWIVEDRGDNEYEPLLYRPQCRCCGASLGGCRTKAEAIAAWNTRPIQPNPEGLDLEKAARLMCRQYYGDHRGMSGDGLAKTVESDWPAFADNAGEVLALIAAARASRPTSGEGEPSISLDGPNQIGFNRQWLSRQLLDSKLTDREAYGIVAYYPPGKDQWSDARPTASPTPAVQDVEGLCTELHADAIRIGKKQGIEPEKLSLSRAEHAILRLLADLASQEGEIARLKLNSRAYADLLSSATSRYEDADRQLEAAEQQVKALEEALRALLTAVTYTAPPKEYGTPDDPNPCYEARVPVQFVIEARAALTSRPDGEG